MKKIIFALIACALIAGCKKSTSACYTCQVTLNNVTVNADTTICVESSFFTYQSGGVYANNGSNNGDIYRYTKK